MRFCRRRKICIRRWHASQTTEETLIKFCFARDRRQAVREVEPMNPAFAAAGLGIDLTVPHSIIPFLWRHSTRRPIAEPGRPQDRRMGGRRSPGPPGAPKAARTPLNAKNGVFPIWNRMPGLEFPGGPNPDPRFPIRDGARAMDDHDRSQRQSQAKQSHRLPTVQEIQSALPCRDDLQTAANVAVNRHDAINQQSTWEDCPPGQRISVANSLRSARFVRSRTSPS